MSPPVSAFFIISFLYLQTRDGSNLNARLELHFSATRINKYRSLIFDDTMQKISLLTMKKSIRLLYDLNELRFIKRGDLMPKIIKDVEKTIRNCAKELFIELDYTHVDMKMISKKSGVAVGTLYNYYENKKQLYLSILKESWQNTFIKLQDITELTLSSEEKLRQFINTLYEEVESRNGLGKTLINTSIVELKNNKEIDDLKHTLTLIMENFFHSLNKVEILNECSRINTRLADSLLVSTLTMFEFYPHDKENNINFLVKFVGLSAK